MKQSREIISEESLNALIDGELSLEESHELRTRLSQNPDMAARLCELRALKDTVKLAYADFPLSTVRSRKSVNRTWVAVAASVTLLVFGTFMGWGLRAQQAPDRVVYLSEGQSGEGLVNAPAADMRIVFHVTNPDLTGASELLDEVETMIALYREQGKSLRVEVVAHGDGLGLLRSKLSPYEARIAQMSSTHKNLSFVACQNTIDRVEVAQGIEVKLVPGTGRTDSGVAHVVRRQNEGWVYIRA